MKITFAIAVALALASPPSAFAEKPAKLSIRDAIALTSALRNMDGHMVVIRPNGQDATIMIPWEFGNGSLRQRIANDLAILDPVAANAERVRQAIIQEILKKSGAAEIKPATSDFEEFQRQYNQALDQPAPGTQDLARIKAAELKLDQNEIPVTVLQAMKPILDQ
jgi:hypothetical protein